MSTLDHIITPEERTARFERWLSCWKAAAALSCSARVLASVQRPHQQRGVKQECSHLPSPGPLKRGRRAYPLWSYTPARSLVPLRQHARIGRAPQPRQRVA